MYQLCLDCQVFGMFTQVFIFSYRGAWAWKMFSFLAGLPLPTADCYEFSSTFSIIVSKVVTRILSGSFKH